VNCWATVIRPPCGLNKATFRAKLVESMSTQITALTWSASRLGEALESLARKTNLCPRQIEVPSPPDLVTAGEEAAIGRWIEGAANWLGIEAEAVEAPYAEFSHVIGHAAPALLRVPDPNEARFLLLSAGHRRTVSILGPDLNIRRVSKGTVRAAICQGIEAPFLNEVDRMLDKAGVSKRRHLHARNAIMRERLNNVRIGGCWLLRLSPERSYLQQSRRARLPHRLLVLLGAHTLQYILFLLSWSIIGRAALQGHVDRGWLWAWALLLLTIIPLRLTSTWSSGMLAIGSGALMKQRLMFGALRLRAEEIRHQGVGQLFGRVIESDAVESLALSGGFLGLFAVIELTMAAVVLSIGAGGGFHVLFLLGWIALIFLIGWHSFRQRSQWTRTRLSMTHDLVERMVGHRTRIAQEAPENWHETEDQVIDRYLDISREMDRATVIQTLLPRGWLLAGFLGLAPAFVSGSGSPASLAISLGGILLGYRALQRLASVLLQLLGAAVAWKQVEPIFSAARRSEYPGLPSFDLELRPVGYEAGTKQILIEAHDLVFRYPGRAEPSLQQCSVKIHSGERLLLVGNSGGGKSTLGSILAGLRTPMSGLLLLGGLDRGVLGPEGWRQRVACAPQFHENHVFMGTFAFNLLMGRGWPAKPQDLKDAEEICRELGLGDLLDRMPAGLSQAVGEMGWQLSHGERSRLFIARTLLQGADLIVLDESFGALDPETLRTCMQCVLARASTLLVIAHP
jgi:ATP-binding cassette, subfamily B, bacterial